LFLKTLFFMTAPAPATALVPWIDPAANAINEAKGFLRFFVFSYCLSLTCSWKSLYRLSLREVLPHFIDHESAAALSTPLPAASRCPDAFNFGRAIRRGSRFARLRFALWLGLRVADRLGLRVTDRLGLPIADRLGQHLEQLSFGLCLIAHRSPP
jgi:hypothetical protein